jgi:hypothetical protein
MIAEICHDIAKMKLITSLSLAILALAVYYAWRSSTRTEVVGEDGLTAEKPDIMTELFVVFVMTFSVVYFAYDVVVSGDGVADKTEMMKYVDRGEPAF